ncbi:chaperone protein DNAJ-like protein [Novymonas esmeraldas]|uniref:Chaperone protein DNAJ-like protein n=1 Tax=Novymonas esmeraldas TaxID=1808958 RepID=A0AAW0FCQ9_9TRYP
MSVSAAPLLRGRDAAVRALHFRSALRHPRRYFQVIQRGHDRPRESLYDVLGFSKDTEARRVRRTPTELRQALLRRVEELRDPVHDPADRKRLEELKDAYTRLHDDLFRANYASHYYASNDARLHVLCDGGQVAANFNPEHRRFTYVDHAIDHDGSVSRGVTAGAHHADAAPSSSETPTADALRDAFRNATGVGAGPSGATASSATAFKASDAAGPQRGADITHLLRITLEQSLAGCEVSVELHKNTRCTTCRGSGQQRLRTPRRCPQCLGRGSTHVPSATYHIERRCLYCGGEGTVPAPPCRACDGRGVRLDQPVRVPVRVPPGTVPNSLFRLRHCGHDGVRGGQTGDVLVTVLVSEHRYFARGSERSSELHAMLPLPLSVALLGGRVTVPTLSGHATLHVPPCVRNGQVLPLDVYGVPDGTGRSSNDTAASPHTLLFHALVMIPKAEALTGRQKAALKRYEEHHLSPSATTDDSGECAAEVQTPPPPPASPDVDARAQLMESCAALKVTYRHWFTA